MKSRESDPQMIAQSRSIFEKGVQSMIRIVEDLLDVTRVRTGKLQLRPGPVCLSAIVEKSLETTRPLIEEKGHHITVCLPSAPVNLVVDAIRIEQILVNLLTNAAKYTEPGGHILLSAHSEGNELVIRVTDDGIGIPPELLPRVFDLFVQGPQTSERGVGGLGLGLALVRNLVSLHDGKVEARSEGPGKGSTFTVRLRALEGAPEKAAQPAATGLLVRRAVNPRRILVVDDNEDALEMLRELLLSAGHEVRTATNGPSALQIVERFQPEIALLDIGLPAMDGYELATRLRARMGAQAPQLMALTGYGQEADRVRSEAAGFMLHLVKPLETSQLLETIARH
jgi:CheY-like chemotaxis protein